MDDIRNKAKTLLAEHQVQVILGYGQGSGNKVRAVFIKDPTKTDQLIYDERCDLNLAVYLNKHEVRHLGKIGIVAPVSVMRSIMLLSSEHQITDEHVVVLGIGMDGKCIDFPDLKSVETYLNTLNINLSDDEIALLNKINAMSIEERWKFWQNEFSKCFKCYACRAACPLCYCHRCTVESNQPQWIPVASHPTGNMEWHIMRAMHLAGRCINCGNCASACPMDIPLNLLTYTLIESIKSEFGVIAGMKADDEFVLSHFKVEDKESFII